MRILALGLGKYKTMWRATIKERQEAISFAQSQKRSPNPD